MSVGGPGGASGIGQKMIRALKGVGAFLTGKLVSKGESEGVRATEVPKHAVSREVEGKSGLAARGVEAGSRSNAKAELGGNESGAEGVEIYSEDQMAVREAFDQLDRPDEVLEQKSRVVCQVSDPRQAEQLLELAADAELGPFLDNAEGSDVTLLINANLLEPAEFRGAYALREALDGKFSKLDVMRFAECKTVEGFEHLASTVDVADMMGEGAPKGPDVVMIDKALYERDDGIYNQDYYDFSANKMLDQGVSRVFLTEGGNVIGEYNQEAGAFKAR